MTKGTRKDTRKGTRTRTRKGTRTRTPPVRRYTKAEQRDLLSRCAELRASGLLLFTRYQSLYPHGAAMQADAFKYIDVLEAYIKRHGPRRG